MRAPGVVAGARGEALTAQLRLVDRLFLGREDRATAAAISAPPPVPPFSATAPAQAAAAAM